MNRVFYKGRFVFAAVMLVMIMLGLGTRLAFLHFGAVNRARLMTMRSYEKQLDGRRGRIMDRRGDPYLLATDYILKDIWIDPMQIQKQAPEHAQKVIDGLASALGLERDEVAEKVGRHSQFAYVRRKTHPEMAHVVEELNLYGVYAREVSVRHYPHGEFMCHVLGFSNHEGVGSAGIELRMDEYLRGVPGFMESVKNGRRREMHHHRGQYVAPESGADVELTIDQYVQDSVERELDKAMAKHHAEGAWAIVQRVQTGEILAMASRPAYDLNKFQKATDKQRRNRAVSYNYEPGSTLKVIAFAEVLDRGLVSARTMINCDQGTSYFGGRPLRDYHAYGLLSVEDCLKKSSNIATAKLAAMLGRKTMHETFVKYNIGSRMRVGLPGEEGGVLRRESKWDGLSLSRMPIGQGIMTTALQVVGVYSAIANQGVMMRPYIVRRVLDADGKTIHEERPQIMGRPMKPSTAVEMCRMLGRVTEQGGTGRRARIAGYKVAGKTGTAQKVIGGRYSDSEHVASFVGFLPAEQPQLAIIVVVDNPQPIHVGGLVAAPAFKEIAEMAVRYLDIPPYEERERRDAHIAFAQ